MADFGKITTGFNTHEVSKTEIKKENEQNTQINDETAETKETLTEVRSGHFIPGQSQVGKDNLAHDLKIFMENPKLAELSNEVFDSLYEKYIGEGYQEADAAGMAASVQSAFVEELLK